MNSFRSAGPRSPRWFETCVHMHPSLKVRIRPPSSIFSFSKLILFYDGPGRYSCVGKNLALREISYLIALIISKHQVAFAPGEDGERVWRDMKDEFTAVPGRLELVFRSLGD